MGELTTNYSLYKPDEGELDWASNINANFDTIDESMGGESLITSWEYSTDVTFVELNIPESSPSELEILIHARFDRALNAQEGIRLQFSTGGSLDTGNNYYRRSVQQGSTSATEQSDSSDSIWIGRFSFTGDTGDSGAFGNAVFNIMGWNNMNSHTNVIGNSGCMVSNSIFVYDRFWGRWKNTGVVDKVKFFAASDSNFTSGSTISIYGKK